MTLALRGSIAALLFGLAGLVQFYPAETREYMQLRFQEFHRFASPVLSMLFIPADLVARIPIVGIHAMGLVISSGAVLAFLDRKGWLVVHGYILVSIGVLLHLPYRNLGVVSQLRKLVFFCAIFFCIIVLAGISTNPLPPRVEKQSRGAESAQPKSGKEPTEDKEKKE